MKPEQLSRIDTTWVYPPFLEAVIKLLDSCNEQGWEYYATSGFRDYDAQGKLHSAYMDRLLLSGLVNSGKATIEETAKYHSILDSGLGGRAAAAGFSAHNFGLAIDFACDSDLSTPGLQPRWDAPAFTVLGATAKNSNLVWGGNFQDMPHVQVPIFISGTDLAPLRGVWLDSRGPTRDRLDAVWAKVDEVLKWT